MSSNRFVHFIDFEASSLSQDSYPIEAGWARLDLDTGVIKSGGMLIKPHVSWTDWNPVSESIHGIPRRTVEEDGLRPQEVAKRLNEELSGQVVLCDGGDYDAHWKSRLYEAAGMEASWRLTSYTQTLLVRRIMDEGGQGGQSGLWQRAMERFKAPRPHRAEADVIALAELFRDAPDL